MISIVPILMTASTTTSGDWTISNFLNSAQQTIAYYGSILTSLIGVAMVIVGIYQVAKNLISHGKGQNSWVVTFALILVGGALAITGGWNMVGKFAQGSRNTLANMAQGSAETSTGDVGDPFQFGATGTTGG